MFEKLQETNEYKEIDEWLINNLFKKDNKIETKIKEWLNKFDKEILDDYIFYISISNFNEIDDNYTLYEYRKDILKILLKYSLYRSSSYYLSEISELEFINNELIDKYELCYSLMSNLKININISELIEKYEIDKKTMINYILNKCKKETDKNISSLFNILSIFNTHEINEILNNYHINDNIKILLLLLTNDDDNLLKGLLMISLYDNVYNIFPNSLPEITNILIKRIHAILNTEENINKYLLNNIDKYDNVYNITKFISINDFLINEDINKKLNRDNIINSYFDFFINELREDKLYIWSTFDNIQFNKQNYINTFLSIEQNDNKFLYDSIYALFIKFYISFDEYVIKNNITESYDFNKDKYFMDILYYLLYIIYLSNNLIDYFGCYENCEFYISFINKYKHIIKRTKYNLYDDILYDFDKLEKRYLKELSKRQQDAG